MFIKNKIWIIVILLLAIALASYLIIFKPIKFGFHNKTLFDWLEIAIIPIFLTIGVFMVDYFNRRNESKSTETKFQNEQRIAQEQYSAAAFNSFLEYYTNIYHSGNKLNNQEKQTLKFKTRSMFRTLNGFWVGELFDFISNTNLGAAIPDIFSETDFKDLEILQSKHRRIELNNSNFLRCNALAVVFMEAIFKTVEFTECVLTGGNMQFSDWRNVSIQSCTANGLQCNSSTLGSCMIHKSSLARARFDSAKILASNFIECNMESTIFDNSTISSSKFIDNICEGISFEKTHMSDIIFEDCSLNDANILNAKLSGCSFSECKFTLIDFTTCFFENTIFVNCEFDETCILPEGFVGDIDEFTVNEVQENIKLRKIGTGELSKRKNTARSKLFSKPKKLTLVDADPQSLTPEKRALALLRKQGMQYKKDEIQDHIIQEIYNALLAASITLDIEASKSHIVDIVTSRVSNCSRSRCDGVLRVLKAGGAITFDNETFLYHINSETFEEFCLKHNDFLEEFFKEYNTSLSKVENYSL